MIPVQPGDWAGRDVLVVAPHPDDEAIGAGGTVHLLAAAGARVAVVIMARGDGGIAPGADAPSVEQRREESIASCQALGTLEPVFLDLKSSAIREDPGAAARVLADAVGEAGADLVLVPSPLERHDTHRACLVAALLSGVGRPGATVWGYGAWDAVPAWPGVLEVDVTPARVAKTMAVRAHASQDSARGLAAAILFRDGAQAAFSRITGSESRKAVERLIDLTSLQRDRSPGESASDLAARVTAWTIKQTANWVTSLWSR